MCRAFLQGFRRVQESLDPQHDGDPPSVDEESAPGTAVNAGYIDGYTGKPSSEK